MNKWPKQDDADVRETNVAVLRQIMDLLYQTHITEPATAKRRGEAIQAINSMLLHLGVDDGIAEQERKPWSQRMRESEIWKGGDHE